MTIGRLPRMTTKTVGPLRIDALVDSVGPTRRVEEMMLDVPEGLIAANRDWLMPDYMDRESDRLILAYQSFVIQMAGTVILVDCAIGEDGYHPARADWHEGKSDWLNHLGLAGLTPEDIDIVFLTHLHVDHTGWLTRKSNGSWQPSFPNARHLVSPIELDFWTNKHDEFAYMASSFPDCVQPALEAGLLEAVEPGDEIAPDLRVVDLAGHSPGMIGLEYCEDDRILAAFCADLMHHPLQMTAVQMATRFCVSPEQAVAVRRHRLTTYAAEKTVLFCGHFPGECAGHVSIAGSGFRFDAVPELAG